MKKIKSVVMVFLLIMAGSLQAQDYQREPLITFEQFEEAISNLRIQGFGATPYIEEDEGEYEAAFVQGNDVFMIKIEPRNHQPVWHKGSYKLDGKDAEFSLIANMGILIIDLPDTYSVLSLSSTKIKDKATLEKIARDTRFMQISPASANWPARIPAAYRIEGLLLESSDSAGSDAGFSYEVRVVMVMSPQLKNSLFKLRNKCVFKGKEEVFLQFADGIILNLPFSDLEDIDDMYNTNEEIRFTYYIP